MISITPEKIYDTWSSCFPEKQQPHRRPGTVLDKKIRARLRDPHWETNILAAIERCAKTKCLHTLEWFQLEFLCRNETNINKALAGWMDWLDRQESKAQADVAQAQQRDSMSKSEKEMMADYVRRSLGIGAESPAELVASAARSAGKPFAKQLLLCLRETERTARLASLCALARDRTDYYRSLSCDFGEAVAKVVRDHVERELQD